MTARLRSLAAPVVLAVALLGACGDDDETAAEVEATTTTTESPDPGPEDDMDAAGAEAVALFQSYEDECAAHAESTGNAVLAPSLFADATFELDDALGEVRVIDGSGTALVVDLETSTFHSVDGPEGELPPSYSFSCPPELFVGTLHG